MMRELTARELETLDWLGGFLPTNVITNCEIKGYMVDRDGDNCKTYLNSPSLREIAEDLNSVAQWLDERANEAEEQ
jgi:hypothetical protein